MKNKKIYILSIIAVLAFCSCHKTCTCTNYSGQEVEYTAEQVKDADVSCSGMVIQSNTRYYSYCTWD